MSHSNDQNGGNRGYGGNYPQNNGQQGQYPSSGNNMQYNYTMNQPYGNAGYSDQYYPPQDPYQQNYAQGSYEEDDYDNLDEIERVNSKLKFLFSLHLHLFSPTISLKLRLGA